MPTRGISDRVHKELLALQQHAIADIMFFKRQQWQICNYALTIDGAFVGVAALLKPFNIGIGWSVVLCVIPTVTLIAGIWLVCDMAKSIDKGRDRIAWARKFFDRRTSLRAYAAGRKRDVALIGSKEKNNLIWFFNGVLGIGWFIVCVLIIAIALRPVPPTPPTV